MGRSACSLIRRTFSVIATAERRSAVTRARKDSQKATTELMKKAMRFAQLLAVVHLCCFTIHVRTISALFPFRNSRSAQKKVGAATFPTSRGVDRTSSKRLPKYLMKLYIRSQKALTDDVNTIRGVFPTSKLTVFLSLSLSDERSTLETLGVAFYLGNTVEYIHQILILRFVSHRCMPLATGHAEYHVYLLSRLRVSCQMRPVLLQTAL